MQEPLLIVHRKVFAPAPTAVTVDTAEEGESMLAVPATTVHNPVPVVGALPANMVAVAQILWSGPALAVVGGVYREIYTSSVEVVQEPLVIVQRKALFPTPIIVTPDVGEVGDVMVTVPEPPTIVHNPVPDIGVLPANVVVVTEHKF